MNDIEMRAILERGMRAAAQALVERVEAREFSAADVAQIRAMYKDCGGVLSFGGHPTAIGDDVLESLSNIDPDMLQN